MIRVATEGSPPLWSRGRLFLFRVSFTFFAMVLTASWTYLAPPRLSDRLEGLNGLLPAGNDALARWIMTQVLHLPPHSPVGGPGHPLAPFVLLGALAALSMSVAVAWSLWQPKATSHHQLSAWLHTTARYSLAAAMLGYGFAKVWPVQFGETLMGPELTRPIGQLRPTALLWLFMGTSRLYAGFAGAVECLAGALLLTRRTACLGALVAMVALGNVAALDLAYDVPVLHVVVTLLLLALLVAAPTLPRAIGALFSSAPIPASEPPPFLSMALQDVRAKVVGALLGGALILRHATVAVTALAAQRAHYPPLALRGAWRVETGREESSRTAELRPDTNAWRDFGFVMGDRALIGQIDGRATYADAVIDTTAATIMLIRRHAPTIVDTSRFSYSVSGSEALSLVPQRAEDGPAMTLHRISSGEFRLISTHYGWVW